MSAMVHHVKVGWTTCRS